MTAVIYQFDRLNRSSPSDETERLFSALGRYSSAELLELLYVGEEPGFFELMRGIYSLSDQSRLVLQNFLTARSPQKMAAAVDEGGRCILTPETCFTPETPLPPENAA
jgi:hypothetical protein